MARGIRYTKEEDLVILRKVSKNPSNLAQCFRELSLELGRSAESISAHYYTVLTKANTNNSSKALFSLFGSRNQNTNRKITRAGLRPTKQSPTKLKASKWKRILTIIFE